MKRILVLGLLLIAFSVSVEAKLHVPDFSQVTTFHGSYSTDKKLNPKNIKLLVWNMYKGTNPSWERDFKKLSSDKDILLLQEAYSTDKMLRVFENDKFGYYFAASFWKDKNGNERTGVANASKVSPDRYSFRRSPDREPVIVTPKMIGITEFDLAGMNKKIAFVNIHAINFVSTKKLVRHLDQIESFASTWDGYLVIGGDFNTWSKKKLQALKEMVARMGLDEVVFDPNDDHRMEVMGNKLDYIFTKGLSHRNAVVHGALDGADHKALTVDLAVK